MYTDTDKMNLDEFIKHFFHTLGIEEDERIDNFYKEAIQSCQCDWTLKQHTYREWLTLVLE